MELWPEIEALVSGDLTTDQRRRLIEALELEDSPRTHGPRAVHSIAHRTFTDTDGTRLVLDFSRVGERGRTWAMTLFFRTGTTRPSSETVEEHRRLFHSIIEELGLRLIEMSPAATEDEVFTPNTPREPEFGVHWNQHIDNLEDTWFHLGLKKDAPREVKAANLRWLMRQQVWAHVPENLRQEAEEFIQGE